jgi:molecular chaperone Hsp33
MDDQNVHSGALRAGNADALGKSGCVPDHIVTASAADGSISIAAGITTSLVGDAQRRHGTAPTATAALGRLMTGAALFGASLKGRERVTLQIVSDGPLRGLIADVQLIAGTTIGARGYANEPAVDLPPTPSGKLDVGGAVGSGRLQVTKSYEVGRPYVGVVPLVSGEIGDDLASYLANSQQIPSVVALGVLVNSGGVAVAGGAIAQVMPGADERTIAELEERVGAMPSITKQIAAGADARDIVRSIAGTIALRAFGELEIRPWCRCSREKVELALQSLGCDELVDMANRDPQTDAICDFCRASYVFSKAEVRELAERVAAARESGA